jgi:hypothetical protein
MTEAECQAGHRCKGELWRSGAASAIEEADSTVASCTSQPAGATLTDWPVDNTHRPS